MTRQLGVGEAGSIHVKHDPWAPAQHRWIATCRVGLGAADTNKATATGHDRDSAVAALEASLAVAHTNARRRQDGETLSFTDWARTWLDLRQIYRTWTPTHMLAPDQKTHVRDLQGDVVENLLNPLLGALRALTDIDTERAIVDTLAALDRAGLPLPPLLGPVRGALWVAHDCRPDRGGPLREFYEEHIHDPWIPPASLPALLTVLRQHDPARGVDLHTLATLSVVTLGHLDQLLATRRRKLDLAGAPYLVDLDERLQYPRLGSSNLGAVDVEQREFRRVALGATAARRLEAWLDELPDPRPDSFIFREPYRGELLRPSWVDTQLRRVTAEISGRTNGLGFADLRRAALLHLAARAGIHTALEFIGHTWQPPQTREGAPAAEQHLTAHDLGQLRGQAVVVPFQGQPASTSLLDGLLDPE